MARLYPHQLCLDLGCQRWRGGRDRYVPPSSTIDSRSYDAAPLSGEGSDRAAAAFLARHHYLGTLPAASEKVALYGPGGTLVGLAIFTHPFPEVIATRELGGAGGECRVLARFTLLDEVPGNGESFFLARCFELLRREQPALRGVVTYADPVPRRLAGGDLLTPGHVGTIYQATNAAYAGRASPKTLRLFPDGSELNADTAGKVRQGKSGWRGGVRLICSKLEMEPPGCYASEKPDIPELA